MHPPPSRPGVVERVRRFVNARYFTQLVATPRGRGFLLSFLADAEESDEAGVFDALLERVREPRLRAMARRHRDDEVKHAAWLREAAARWGGPSRVPGGLRVVPRIDRHAGGVARAFVDGDAGVLEAYALLQVIEERAVREYPAIVRALRGVDPAGAEVLARVVRDEARHVKYARAIGRAYAPDEGAYRRTLWRYRRAEAIAFEEQGRAFLQHVLERGLLEVRWPERLFWGAMAGRPVAALAG
jgi:rubrerythrin